MKATLFEPTRHRTPPRQAGAARGLDRARATPCQGMTLLGEPLKVRAMLGLVLSLARSWIAAAGPLARLVAGDAAVPLEPTPPPVREPA